MKKVIVFGFGERGKKLVDECLAYDTGVSVTAIADNHASTQSYRGIPVIEPQAISAHPYDEIWVCTVYYEEIMEQLASSCGIGKDKIRFTEPVAPVLEYRLRKKYGNQLQGLEPVPEGMEAVLSYLKDNPLRMYCYPFYEEYLNRKTEMYFDEKKSLYYGKYMGRKLYFARSFDTEAKARAYFNAITMEQDTRSPHCYWNDGKLHQAFGGVGIDVGAAEGIFALGMVDRAEHIYLVEAEEQWAEALRYTFEPYRDRVTIIRGFIGSEDSDSCTRLDTLFHGKRIDFMKMDIEGMELDALQGAEKLILDNHMSLAVCVYHHRADNERIGSWLRERGYRVRNSRGLVVCLGEWELERDEADFRKALLFADRKD